MQEKTGVGSKEVFRAGSALAGGVARQNETCGALIGAIMAIGCLSGRENFEDKEQYEKAHKLAMEVYKLFKEEVGHTVCAEIHKKRYGKVYWLNLPEERKAFHDMGGHSRTGCPEVCGSAARIAAEVIMDIKKKP